jgi:hypothetical protein
MKKTIASFALMLMTVITICQSPCDNIQAMSCGDTSTVAIDSGLGIWNFYPSPGSGLLAGKESIYSFTPELTGVYDLRVIAALETGVQYFMKPAASGCSMYGWQPVVYCYSAPSIGTMGELAAGTEYYILLDQSQEYTGAMQEFTIDCNLSFPPCEAVMSISCGDTVDVNFPEGSGSLQLYNCFYDPWPSAGMEQIFLYTADASGVTAINVTASTGNFVNYYISSAEGSCEDAVWTCLGGVNYTSGSVMTAPFSVEEGQSYYIVAAAAFIQGANQSFRIICPEIIIPCEEEPVEINCGTQVDAIIDPGFGAFDTVGQYCHPMAPIHPNYGRERFYAFTPTSDGIYTIQVTSVDGMDVTYTIGESGNCDPENWQCIGNASWSATMMIEQSLQAGNTYILMLDAGTTSGAHHTFEISCTPIPDPCADILNVECSASFTVQMADDPGMYDLVNPVAMLQTTGGEQILSFTAEVTGTYQLHFLAHSGSPSAVYFRESATGCSEEGWIPVSYSFGGDMMSTIPQTLIAGDQYYLLFDCANYNYGDYTTDSVMIVCPVVTYDPCQGIETIASCGDTITTTHSTGLGLVSPFPFNGYPYYGAAGKENIFSFTAPSTGKFSITGHSTTGSNINYAARLAGDFCETEGWSNVALVESWTLHQPFLIPFELQEGETYHILADAQDTLGVTQTFTIDCYTPVDPCDTIIVIDNCSDYIYANFPPGPGMYTMDCNNWPFPGGGELIFEYTAQASGSLLFQGSQSNAFNLYVKPASLGCGPEDWLCLHQESYTTFTFIPQYEVVEGETYYFLFQQWNNQQGWGYISVNISCSANCLIYADADGDGYGDPSQSYTFCGFLQQGYAANNNDCDDVNTLINPLMSEECNGIDEDCNGLVDEDFDQDSDGFTTCGGDCDDTASTINPDSEEICWNETDDNCNGETDEGCVNGIDESGAADQVKMAIYPNPSDQAAMLILLSGQNDQCVLNIISSTGQLVHTQRINVITGETRIELATGKMTEGLYTIQAITPLWQKADKLVIQHD